MSVSVPMPTGLRSAKSKQRDAGQSGRTLCAKQSVPSIALHSERP